MHISACWEGDSYPSAEDCERKRCAKSFGATVKKILFIVSCAYIQEFVSVYDSGFRFLGCVFRANAE